MEQQAKPSQEETVMEQHVQQSGVFTSRRSFLRKGRAVGGAGAIGAGLLAPDHSTRTSLTHRRRRVRL